MQRNELITIDHFILDMQSRHPEATGEFTTMRPKAALRLGLVGSDYMETFGPILEFNYDGGAV